MDMQQETLKRLKMQKIFMISTILINVTLNILLAIQVQKCNQNKCKIEFM